MTSALLTQVLKLNQLLLSTTDSASFSITTTVTSQLTTATHIAHTKHTLEDAATPTSTTDTSPSLVEIPVPTSVPTPDPSTSATMTSFVASVMSSSLTTTTTTTFDSTPTVPTIAQHGTPAGIPNWVTCVLSAGAGAILITMIWTLWYFLYYSKRLRRQAARNAQPTLVRDDDAAERGPARKKRAATLLKSRRASYLLNFADEHASEKSQSRWQRARSYLRGGSKGVREEVVDVDRHSTCSQYANTVDERVVPVVDGYADQRFSVDDGQGVVARRSGQGGYAREV